MSRMVLTLAVEDANVNPQGVKEAVAMALERFGPVRVLRVETQDAEQMRMTGVARNEKRR